MHDINDEQVGSIQDQRSLVWVLVDILLRYLE